MRFNKPNHKSEVKDVLLDWRSVKFTPKRDDTKYVRFYGPYMHPLYDY